MRSRSDGRGTWSGVIAAVVLAGGCVAACGDEPRLGPPGNGGRLAGAGGGDTGGGGGAGGGGATGGVIGTGGGGATGGVTGTGGGGSGGGAIGDGTETGGVGAGVPAGSRSCGPEGMDALCGPERISCCDSRLVPGGTFNRQFDGVNSTDDSHPATVSSFLLDTYEVTMGRFRAFLEAGQGTRASAPEVGAGAHPAVPGSGWSAEWNQWLKEDPAALMSSLRCIMVSGQSNWTREAGPNENLPISCLTWPEAFAFCVWDGGRLPTATELNYAASGGDEHREYPWGQGFDSSRMIYDCLGDGSPAGHCALSDTLPVGSRPAGAGRWGQRDLSGSVSEFTRDWSGALPVPCVDCIVLERPSTGPYFQIHGGNFEQSASYQRAISSDSYQYPTRSAGIGVRCARTPPPEPRVE